jgi:hypothetical protein
MEIFTLTKTHTYYNVRHPPSPHLVVDAPLLILATLGTLGTLGIRLGILGTRHPTLVSVLY